jgi:hypothetical protein
MHISKSLKRHLVIMALVAGTGPVLARASEISFASFLDNATGQWSYNNGILKATGASAAFTAVGGPDAVLNYSGPVTYSLTATEGSLPLNTSGVITQVMNGEITFMNGPTTVLDVVFTGVLGGNNGGTNATLIADALTPGEKVIETADAPVMLVPFNEPESISISLTGLSTGLASAGPNFSNFTATASGSFASTSGSGASAPEPSSLALLGAAGLALLRRRRA